LLAARPEVTGLKAEGGLVALRLPDPESFLAALSLFGREAEPGGLRSSALVSADGRVILSVGVEHADDILADLAAALTLHQHRDAP
jgi:cystathionine beta-lyase/cystathionine gamma-synthase